MKNLFLIALLTIATLANAGKNKVLETNYKFTIGSKTALSTYIHEATLKDVEKAWKDIMKDAKAKIKSKKDELHADDAILPSITTHPMDIYAAFVEDKNGVAVYITVDFGGAFISSTSHPKEYQDLSSLLSDFGYNQTKIAIDEKLSNAEKELKKIEDDYEKEMKNEQSMKDDIEKLKDKISKSKDEQENQKAAIEAQKKLLNEINQKKSKLL